MWQPAARRVRPIKLASTQVKDMAALEALSSTDQLFNEFIIYDTISATSTTQPPPPPPPSPPQGRRKKKRKRRTRCKNRQEAETQRMTHITVERNRRKQMNQHLSVLRSLMPNSYVQRGDQASIVGGAIEFVKELERLVHSLEAQKLHQMIVHDHEDDDEDDQAVMMINSSSCCCSKINTTSSSSSSLITLSDAPLISHLFLNPDHDEKQQQLPTKYTSIIRSKAAMGDMEVTLIQAHANLRILCQKIPRQLTKLVTGLHSLCLTVLHINVTTIEPLVLYSISAKVEEGCQLNSADDIAGSVYHMLRIIEQERLRSCDHVPI